MKKLAVLVLLLAMAALPIMAEVTLSGNFEYGFATDFDTGFNQGFGGAPDYNFLKATAKVDDFNTVNVEFYANPGAVADAVRFIYLSTDLAAVFGLEGTGLKMDIGQLRAQNERYSVGGYWADRAYSFRPGYRPTVDLVISPMKLFNVEVAFTPNVTDGVQQNDQAIWLGAYGTFGVISAEAYYFNDNTAAPEGAIGVAAKAALAPAEGISLTVIPSFGFDLNDAAANAWTYGLGVGVGAGMVSGTVNLNGNETDALNKLAATVTLKPVANLALNAGAMFYLADAATETFDNFDVTLAYTAGAATMRLGYLYTTTGAVAGAPGYLDGPAVAGPDGGLHFDVVIGF